MKHLLRTAIAAGALIGAASVAEAGTITWDFGTSGGKLLNPSGSFSAPASGFNNKITTMSGQEAVFQSGSGGSFVGVNGWSSVSGNNNANPPTSGTPSSTDPSNISQANNFRQNSISTSGIGVCASNCSGNPGVDIADTELLRVDLNDGASGHPSWNLDSILFSNFVANPADQVEFWFTTSADPNPLSTNPQIDLTKLQSGSSDRCVGGIINDTCLFNFSAINDNSINAYQYLWVEAVNPDSNTSPQPNVLLDQLTGMTAPAPSIGVGLPASLVVGGLLFGATALGRGKKPRSLGTAIRRA